jgi:hypothetical protein
MIAHDVAGVTVVAICDPARKAPPRNTSTMSSVIWNGTASAAAGGDPSSGRIAGGPVDSGWRRMNAGLLAAGSASGRSAA